MANDSAKVNANYERFYAARTATKLYPTEFVVRTFLARYPQLNFVRPAPGARVLDVAFGDGRNTGFLCEQGYAVSGIEITQGIVEQTSARLRQGGYEVDLRVGRNSAIPFEDNAFDAILACACCYYCDEGESMQDNLAEYARVLKPGGWLVASVADSASYIFENAESLADGSYRIAKDHYANRVGYRLHGFSTTNALQDYFSSHFENFSIGSSVNDYFGIREKLFWVACQSH